MLFYGLILFIQRGRVCVRECVLYYIQKDKMGCLASRNSQTYKNNVCNFRTDRLWRAGSLRVATVASMPST